MVGRSTSPHPATSEPSVRTTATWTRCVLSASPFRVTVTSAGSGTRGTLQRVDAGEDLKWTDPEWLTATHEWDLTADLPQVESNTGLEAITWVPDSYLVARGFYDEARSAVYDPALYPDHGGGLFFVGVEANGRIYAYALNHANGSFTRVASFASGLAGVMGLEFDPALNQLWAVCDDGCSGRSAVFAVDARVGSATIGRFIAIRLFDRPTGMANLNNEGFAMASQSECVANSKPVFWADDAATGGHALRRGTVTCTPFSSP